MRLVFFFLTLALAGLQYKLFLGEESLLRWQSLKQKIAQQYMENEKFAAKNHALEADILELKNGEQALEEQARYELGMIKNNEVYYQFIE